MRICRVEEPEMSGVSVFEVYTHISYVETRLSEHDENISPPPTSSYLERPPALLSVPRLPCSFKRAARRLSLHGDPASDIGTRIDLLALLPPEISILILRFLHPRYLCRVVLVSRRWCWLAQYSSLRARRLRYIQHKREKYLQSKENLVPGQRHPSQTPRTLTRNSLTNSGSSPLTSIQSSRHRHMHIWNSPRSGSIRDGETPVQLPRFHHSLYHSESQLVGSPVLRTPENSGLGMCGAVEDDPGYLVRRCLFPHSDTPARTRPKKTPYLTSSVNEETSVDVELFKKSASKRRLKRL